MKKQLIATTVALAALGITSTAMAGAKSGFVVGAQIGYAKANADLKNLSTADINKGNVYYGATVGIDAAVMPLLALGVEAGVFYSNDISKISDSGSTDKVSNLIVPLLVKAQLATPVGFDVFVKGGISYVVPSVSKTGSSINVNWKNSWSPTAAGGLGYQIGPLNIFVQYMHIFGKDEVNSGGDGYASKIDAITAGATFTF